MKELKQKEAIELRKSGLSLKDIAKRLEVSKGSVSVWVRGVNLSEQQKELLKNNQRANANAMLLRKISKTELRRQEFIAKGFERAKLDHNFRIVCALYWGEGNKTNYYVQISNSDASLLDVIVQWLINEKYDFYFRCYYYSENGLTENEINNWWLGKIRGLKPSQLRKNIRCPINRASQNKKIGKLPYGTGRLIVRKSANLFSEIMGGIEFLKTAISSMAEC